MGHDQIPRARQRIDDGLFRRQNQIREWRWRHGKFSLPRWYRISAVGRRSAEDAACGGITVQGARFAGSFISSQVTSVCNPWIYLDYWYRCSTVSLTHLPVHGRGWSIAYLWRDPHRQFCPWSFFMVGAYLAYSTIKFMGNPLWFWPALVIVGLGVGILGARMSAGGRQLKIRVPRAARARPPATRRSNGRQVFAIPGSRAIRESQGCGSRRFPS